MHSSPANFWGLFETLLEHQVKFIIVGGVCAVLNGAPINTFDLDIVHARDPENIARLLKALQHLDAIYRAQLSRRLSPTASHLSGKEHQLLMTRFGPLDALGVIGEDEGFDELLPHSKTFELKGMRLRTLNLSKLIELKAHANRPKDRMVLPILRETLREQNS